jgi:deazaflavin-dependent oxidoreductase (nitroreductase family)
MRRLLLLAAGVAAAWLGIRYVWRTNPRLGTRWANETMNPLLIRWGAIAAGGRDLGLIEHVGRHSGTVRVTPVHPVRTPSGFRIVVPLGPKSEWAHNVLAAGRCRLQVEEVVYELDEPALVAAAEMTELPAFIRWATARMGFMYLRLHRFAEHQGSLGMTASTPESIVPQTPEPAPTADSPAKDARPVLAG